MCLICVQWELGKLTNKEALRNLGEFVISDEDDAEKLDHYYEVYEKILDKEMPIEDND